MPLVPSVYTLWRENIPDRRPEKPTPLWLKSIIFVSSLILLHALSKLTDGPVNQLLYLHIKPKIDVLNAEMKELGITFGQNDISEDDREVWGGVMMSAVPPEKEITEYVEVIDAAQRALHFFPKRFWQSGTLSEGVDFIPIVYDKDETRQYEYYLRTEEDGSTTIAVYLYPSPFATVVDKLFPGLAFSRSERTMPMVKALIHMLFTKYPEQAQNLMDNFGSQAPENIPFLEALEKTTQVFRGETTSVQPETLTEMARFFDSATGSAPGTYADFFKRIDGQLLCDIQQEIAPDYFGWDEAEK